MTAKPLSVVPYGKRILYGCICSFLMITGTLAEAPANPVPDTSVKNNRWCRVYFTSPGRGGNAATENPQTALIRLINSARTSIFGAFYKISSPEVTAALLKAKVRGVDVRIVTESDNGTTHQIILLRKNGIPVVCDRRRGLMHHKFAVIDGKTIWTGSYNLTHNGTARNNNNGIEINSPELSAIFTDEFSEMHSSRIFGNRSEPGLFSVLGNRHYVNIQGTPVNVYFSPEDSIERILLKRLKKAKKSVRFMAYSFTSVPLAEELIKLHKKGIQVCGIFEKTGTINRKSQYIKMKLEGLSVYTDTNPGNMHHKVIIIDDEILVTGSYNFSKGANRKNDENILIIADRDIARQYVEEFQRLKPR